MTHSPNMSSAWLTALLCNLWNERLFSLSLTDGVTQLTQPKGARASVACVRNENCNEKSD